MTSAITKINKNLIQKIEKNGISDIIKPLVKEIEMQDMYISGTLSIHKNAYKKLKEGDCLNLKRDVDNKFDDYAIAMFTKEGEKVGFIQEQYSKLYYNLISAGKLIIGKVKKINTTYEPFQILVTLYLKDF